MLLNLIQGKEFDIRKFAEVLERNAQDGVKWERRKLDWILEEERQEATRREQETA